MPFIKGQKAHNFIDLVGLRFEKLLVVSRSNNTKDGRSMWLCKCDCGNDKIVKGKYLLNGDTKSCGCLNIESIISRNISSAKRHNESRTQIYRAWYNILSRCYKTDDENSKYYKDKGITVCDEWHTYENFRDWCIKNGFEDGLTIDRIDPDGNYEPLNCRWVTWKVQANNRSKGKI